MSRWCGRRDLNPGFFPTGVGQKRYARCWQACGERFALIPVLDQTRLRPHRPTEAHLIAKALTFHASSGGVPSLVPACRVGAGHSNRFDLLNCKRQYGHLGWYSVNDVLHFGQYQPKPRTTLVQEWNSRFQRFLCGCSFEALYESSRVEALRAGFGAVEDRVTSPETIL